MWACSGHHKSNLKKLSDLTFLRRVAVLRPSTVLISGHVQLMVCGFNGLTTHHAVQNAEMVTKQDIANARIPNLMDWTAKATAKRRLVVKLRIAQV